MRCSHPMCKRGIGLVSYRPAFGKRRYCSRACRYNYAGERLGPLPQRSADARLFAWLFAAPSAGGHDDQVPAAIRVRSR
jgi:hypothetical protein